MMKVQLSSRNIPDTQIQKNKSNLSNEIVDKANKSND